MKAKSNQNQRVAHRKARARWIASSLLFQSTALAGTLAGVPMPFYSRGYSRAYAAATCDPSSTSGIINDTSGASSTTFSCTISSTTTLTSSQYAYGGAYTFYQDLKKYRFYDKYANGLNYYTDFYHRISKGQPGLNISVTNSATIDVTAASDTSNLISTTTNSSYLYYMNATQTAGLSVVSRGSNAWYYSAQGGVSGDGGDGGNVYIKNTGSITSTVGGGIYALSRGGDGLLAYRGGNGGTVTIVSSGDVSGSTSGIVAISLGGTSHGPVYGYQRNAQAGTGGDVSVTVYGNVSATTSGPAVFAASYGGNSPRAKSTFYNYADEVYYWRGEQLEGGGGGDAGSVTVNIGSSTTAFSGTISTVSSGDISAAGITRSSGAAISAISIGGQGINTYSDGYDTYYSGGKGGDVTIDVVATSSALIETKGDNSPAILAQSAGGASPQDTSSFNTTLSAYTGGDGGTVSVTLSGGGTIETTGNYSSGVVAQSLGGAGKSTLDDSTYGNAGSGGSVTVKSDFTITTKGNYSHGIVAQSAAAAFGYGIYSYDGNGDLIWGDDNDSSSGSGDVTVYNYGNITTYGYSSHGIIAQSIGGGGGILNATATLATNSDGTLDTKASQTIGSGSTGAAGATVKVTNSGTIITHGGTSSTDELKIDDTVLTGGIGILAQSIGGGGGVIIGSGTAAAIGGSGDDGDDGSDGGAVYVTNSGTIITYGAEAHGIVAQSIGGGGGVGTNGYGFISSIGGSGGNGGAGGAVTVTNSGTIKTAGDYASAIIAQSIGGGGGTGGKASTFGLGLAISTGGSGGGGGDGGTVTLKTTSSSVISTSGDHATAILLQSIGGGGGSGGSAKSDADGADFSLSIATGGSGGDGGDGGSVYSTLAGTVSTTGTDSIGVLVQSIGGGGGDGGGSTANSLAVGIPDNEEGGSYALAISISHGGSGGDGGDGGKAFAHVDQGATISTTGDGSSALVVQSIGGGGGSGGDSTAASGTFTLQAMLESLSHSLAELEGDTVTLGLEVSIGGSAGGGGDGGFAYAHNEGTISTEGDFAYGMLVQSIGGGGGTGGTGKSKALDIFTDTKTNLSVTLGGSSSSGGDGGTAKGGVSSTGSITTTGDNSIALAVQSIGGGGGTGGSGTGQADADNSIALAFGSTGGSGGKGGTAYAWNAGTIITKGDASNGVLVQSIGGGGGTGGDGTSSVTHASDFDKELKKFQNVTLKASGDITTTISGTLGASGGDGGDGGKVYFGIGTTGDDKEIKTGLIKTYGPISHGVVAQSIGGGGGSVAVSSSQNETTLAANLDGFNSLSVDVSLGLGAVSDDMPGNGDDVTVYASDTYTYGFSSIGVIAQSIGGGGGVATFSGYAADSIAITLGAKLSNGDDDASLTSGDVYVALVSGEKIATTGDNSSGVIAQSIAGGGGIAITALGTETDVNDDTISDVITVQLGTYGSGDMLPNIQSGTVSVTNSGTIKTTGTRAFGIVAQSIGAGGGLVNASSAAISSVTFVEKAYTGGADDVSVSLSSGTIITSGDGAAGVVAQSIAGGGGLAADLSSGRIYAYYVSKSDAKYSYYSKDYLQGYANSGTVTVTVDDNSSISTSGDYAHGIIAQSISGSGGIFERNGKVYAGSLHRYLSSGFTSSSGDVNVTVDGSVTVTGAHSWGVWTQTQDSTITVTVGSSGSISSTSSSDSNGGAVYAAYSSKGSFKLVNSGNITGNVVVSKAGTVSTYKDYSSTVSASADGVISLSSEAAEGSSLMLNQGTFTTGVIAGLSTVLNSGQINIGGEGNIQQTVFTGDLIGVGSSDYGSTYDAETLGLSSLFSAFSYYSGTTKTSWSTTSSSKGGLITGLDVDMENGISDTIVVEGDFAGTWGVDVNANSLLPNSRTDFLKVMGTDSSDISVLDSLVYDFSDISTSSDGWLGFSVDSAKFANSGVSLGRNASEVASAMQQAWDSIKDGSATEITFGDDEISLGQLFGAFNQSNAETFSDMLLTLASQTAAAPLADSPSAAIAAANSVLSCPAFETGSVITDEGSCVWGRLYGSDARQGGVNDSSAFNKSSAGIQAGGQTALEDGWFLGAGVTYENSWFFNDSRTEKMSQEAFTGAVALKKEVGNWLFGLVGGGGYNWGDSKRYINLDTLSAVAEGSPDSAMLFARARASYEFALSDDFYMRPRVDLDVVNMYQKSYNETGAGALNLKVDSNSDTVFGVTPAIEFGAKLPFLEDMPARLYADLGVSFLSSDEWETTAKLAGLSSMDSFSTFTPIADTVGHVTLGLDLAKRQGMEFKIQYEGSFADEYQSHVGSLRFGYRF
ncbi:autotransporter outer membrane beta-barrel domain-containing protein [Martelella alba]|uniref:Autotransporter outer membrane beta-barrel domain-containing protein n=1 Tax=Martelella alba TaxID=2590451 RepID=A0A506UE34_9HYPH|nr:autotransporter outer membrane beta-barrel domain-containing protein [Martelella alba]TPW29987.1 autotransporter outer membrane beta-barrel domain-containing protein [Martelella alba]